MYTIHEPSAATMAMTEHERRQVREQLDRMLQTHHFKNSRRYPALLRFIVEEALEGRGEYLKERLLGVRVFDRPADYDTASDPVVRVTIAEIRKRIAQYYHDEEHDAEIRIELLPGRYAPEFRSRSVRKDGGLEPAAAADSVEASLPAPPFDHAPAHPATGFGEPAAPRYRGGYRLLSAALALVLLGIAAVPVVHWLNPSALDELWAPLLTSQRLVLFCVPTDVGKSKGPIVDSDAGGVSSAAPEADPPGKATPSFLAFETLGQNVVYSDMLATLKVASILAVHHHDYRARLNTSTNLEDLRQGPAVLIGGMDNQWTMRALAPLRFRFAGSDEDRYWIGDARDSRNRTWSLDLKLQYGAITRDYAIIARLHNDQTGQPEMIVAGIGMSGTAAAGEFITDERRVKELKERIGPGFKDHDFEAVLSTDVVNGIAGAPRILAVTVW